MFPGISSDVKEWNEQNKPKVEFNEETDGIVQTYGVFELPNGIFWGRKYSNGYHPIMLHRLPPRLLQLIKAGF